MENVLSLSDWLKISEVKRMGRLTHASIYQAGSIRVNGNAVFPEIGGFKNTSSIDELLRGAQEMAYQLLGSNRE